MVCFVSDAVRRVSCVVYGGGAEKDFILWLHVFMYQLKNTKLDADYVDEHVPSKIDCNDSEGAS